MVAKVHSINNRLYKRRIERKASTLVTQFRKRENVSAVKARFSGKLRKGKK